jgi:hypothetical protein
MLHREGIARMETIGSYDNKLQAIEGRESLKLEVVIKLVLGRRRWWCCFLS